jgi:peptidoglycan/LPS O-acetylase OafA/YrhL
VNGLRGTAILAVLYHHLLMEHLTPIFSQRVLKVGRYVFPFHTMFTNGWMGVNLFFVLSGFVLALPYALGERALARPGDAVAFYARRARRLLPLYYLCLFVGYFVGPATDFFSPVFLREFWSLLTFTFVFQIELFLPRVNVALWSLGVEFWFSALFPLILIVGRRLGLVRFVVLSFVFALAVRFWGVFTWPGGPAHQTYIKDGVFGRLDDFAVGMGIAELYAKKRLPSRVPATLFLPLGIALVTLGAAAWDNAVFRILPYRLTPLLNIFVNVGFGLVLIGLLGPVPRLLRTVFTFPPLQLAGMMCYSLYLWHLLGTNQRLAPWWRVSYVVPYLAFTFLISAMTYRYVEFPDQSFRKLFLKFPK